MRVKTEAKRDEILSAAQVEFGQRGYHDTTLSHVAERMGSSKATIYNYFRTKEDLFGAMLAAAALPTVTKLIEVFASSASFADQLQSFARAYVRMTASANAVALQRLLIAEPAAWRAVRPQMGSRADFLGWPFLTEQFRREQAKGVLRAGDPDEMADQLRASLHGNVPYKLLFGERETYGEAEMDAAADASVRAFLAAFGK